MAYKKNPFKPTLSYEGRVLSGYKQRINIQNKLLATIKASVPDRLASHILYCAFSEQKVSLYTDSAIWSSQLRFYHQAMLNTVLSSNFGSFQSLQIKVIPKSTTPEDKDNKTYPSAENISAILGAADLQTDDLLKNALLNLGKTFQKKCRDKKM